MALTPLTQLALDPFPVLTTERLVLRCMEPHDDAALFAMRSDERTMQHIGRPRATTIDDARALIERITAERMAGTGITWTITRKGDDGLIGTIGYYRMKLEHFRGEVGYMLAPDHWRQGLMSEALDAAVQCGFQRFGLHSIEAITDPGNIASNALLKRCGFVREGLFKENYFWNGRFFDSAVWSRMAPC